MPCSPRPTCDGKVRLASALKRHPLAGVVLLELGYLVLVIGGSVALSALVPDLPGYSVTGPSQSLLLVIGSAVLLLVLIGGLGWWALAGFTAPRFWRDLRLYWLPIVLLLVPFVGGFRPVAPDAIGLLVIAYVATAVFEEGFWRGLVLRVLRPTGL